MWQEDVFATWEEWREEYVSVLRSEGVVPEGEGVDESLVEAMRPYFDKGVGPREAVDTEYGDDPLLRVVF
jgi:hypothetical protein